MNTALDSLIDVRRGQWGGGKFPRAHAIVETHPYVEIHHSVYPARLGGAEQCRRIEQQHLNLEWNGAFYGLGVEVPTGLIYELRGIHRRSIGAYNPKYNDGTWVSPNALCVVLLADMRESTITPQVRHSLDLIRGTLPDPVVRWHNMRDATACPGPNTIPVLERMNTYIPIHTPPITPDTIEDDDMELLYDTSNWNCWVSVGGGVVHPVSVTDFHPWWVAQAKNHNKFAWTGKIISHPYMTTIVNQSMTTKAA